MAKPDILSTREDFSRQRLADLRELLGSKPEASMDNLAIFCGGSYARLEASQYSDIDLFFVYGGDVDDTKISKLKELKLFSAVIDVAAEMNFPEFSNDGQYLQTLKCDQVLHHLGSPEDDGLNLFTLRMLMLLESKCISGDSVFRKIQEDIIAAYYRDYPDHQSSFEPWFMINDIGRFWKTLLLNYEHKRNQPALDLVQKNKQKVRNFKLKFSRMTTCFATVAAIASLENPDESTLLELVQKTPQERLSEVASALPEVEQNVARVLDRYAWFVEQTGQTEEQLRSGFDDKSKRAERFQLANEYGDAMYELIARVGELRSDGDGNRLLRFLVI